MHYLNALPVAPQTCKYLFPLNLFLVYCLSQVVAHSVIRIGNVEVSLHLPVSFLISPSLSPYPTHLHPTVLTTKTKTAVIP